MWAAKHCSILFSPERFYVRSSFSWWECLTFPIMLFASAKHVPFSYPEPFLRAVRQGALAKSISNWHLIGYNEGYCSNNGYILLPCFYGIRFWIWAHLARAPRRTARKKGSGYENKHWRKKMGVSVKNSKGCVCQKCVRCRKCSLA